MADYHVAKAPDVLSTMGIGSCVALCLYDKGQKIGGLAHIMLSRSGIGSPDGSGRYADTAMPGLLSKLTEQGACMQRLTAKMVGGASVFPTNGTAAITVGKDNIETIKRMLADRNIPLTAEDTGGCCGRRLIFDPQTGQIEITVLTNPPTKIVI